MLPIYHKTNEQATTEVFLRFLLAIGVAQNNTPRYYMVVRQYPYELYRENARRFVAVQKLIVAYDVSERKIYELLSTNSKKIVQSCAINKLITLSTFA